MRTIFRLVVIFLMAHALFRFVPPYYHHHRFSMELKDAALTWRETTEHGVLLKVLDLAAAHQVPITQEHVTVRIVRDHLLIDVAYEVPIEWVPGMKRPWQFNEHFDIWVIPSEQIKIPR